MKKLLLIAVLFAACKTEKQKQFDILSARYDSSEKVYDSFNVLFHRRDDSCRAINIFIDNLPKELKYNKVISTTYHKNLDYLLQQNNYRYVLNQQSSHILNQMQILLK